MSRHPDPFNANGAARAEERARIAALYPSPMPPDLAFAAQLAMLPASGAARFEAWADCFAAVELDMLGPGAGRKGGRP